MQCIKQLGLHKIQLCAVYDACKLVYSIAMHACISCALILL